MNTESANMEEIAALVELLGTEPLHPDRVIETIGAVNSREGRVSAVTPRGSTLRTVNVVASRDLKRTAHVTIEATDLPSLGTLETRFGPYVQPARYPSGEQFVVFEVRRPAGSVSISAKVPEAAEVAGSTQPDLITVAAPR